LDEIGSRLTPEHADVFLLTKGGLAERSHDVAVGEAPREFFYNLPDLISAGVDARMLNTSELGTSLLDKTLFGGEKLVARLTGISNRFSYLRRYHDTLADARAIVSYVDHLSLALGRHFNGQRRPVTVGLFHGLCDYPTWLTPFGRSIARSYTLKALRGLDVVGFFGPADMVEARRRFELSADKTALVRFGVDSDFWRPVPTEASGAKDEPFNIISVGSDPSRDYDTLLNAEIDTNMTLVTRLPLRIENDRRNVTVTRGAFWDSRLTDTGLRELYARADVAVVPLKDVYQPTGYSVTLQAMSCGCPVVLSDIKGLWAPDILVHDENCLKVPPGDANALAEAVHRLRDDPDLAARISKKARKTVETEFSLKNMYASFASLFERVDKIAVSRGSRT